MKVTIKNINKEIYNFDVNGDLTVIELKNLISEKHNQNPSWQTLIYSGKILEDKRTLESYNITEAGFIVMMIKKPRETSAASTTTATTESSSTTATTTPTTAASTTTPTPTPTASNNTPVTPNPTPTTSSTPSSTPASTTSPQQASDFATGSELEATIKNITDMGFERDQVLRALRQTFNNAERAVEYLLSGSIPASDPEDEADDMEGGGGGGSGGENPFDSLRNHPHFPMLRDAISKNPNIIPSILQQLAQTNPELVRQISENPNDFIRLFQEGGEGGNPGQFTIQVTQEESEAIQRLQTLTGMDKTVVIEAYFACDKNEELAASYLFEREEDE